MPAGAGRRAATSDFSTDVVIPDNGRFPLCLALTPRARGGAAGTDLTPARNTPSTRNGPAPRVPLTPRSRGDAAKTDLTPDTSYRCSPAQPPFTLTATETRVRPSSGSASAHVAGKPVKIAVHVSGCADTARPIRPLTARSRAPRKAPIGHPPHIRCFRLATARCPSDGLKDTPLVLYSRA